MLPRKGLHRVDIHHHFFPQNLNKAKLNDNLGWKTPAENLPWDPTVSIRSMDALGTQIALLSLPANPFGEVSLENRQLARAHNQFAANVCKEYPSRFGFLASLPFLDDVDGKPLTFVDGVQLNNYIGVLEEIAFAFDTLQAEGIALTSSYGFGQDSS